MQTFPFKGQNALQKKALTLPGAEAWNPTNMKEKGLVYQISFPGTGNLKAMHKVWAFQTLTWFILI